MDEFLVAQAKKGDCQMQYLISVILPVFQVKKYLDSALESLKKQTIGFDNIQVIFVDDCSTDGCWEKVQQYDEL